MSETPRTLALALGGLAGSNAFGAGVLEAAHDLGVRPQLISATSGQLYWLDHYLQRDAGGPRLRDLLQRDIDLVERTGHRDLDMVLLAARGVPGAMRPAWWEYPQDLVHNWLQAWAAILTGGRNTSLVEETLAIAPGRVLVPDFPDSFFGQMSGTFNATDIGIAFNSYSPGQGLEYVHLNDAARAAYGAVGRPGRTSYGPGERSAHRDRTVYQPITPEAVRNGLWLYEYGFEGGTAYVDGAYYRQVMLAELWPATDIVAVRPLSNAWRGEMPTTYIGIQDLKTEVSFDGAYAGERQQITLVNALLAAGDLPSSSYHPIAVHELELRRQRGFVDYLFEEVSVFDEGYEVGLELLRRLA